MQIANVGLMSPGDMGQALAMQIKARGISVCTALAGRSERSRALAYEAQLIDVGSVARLVAQCDVVLSVMNPGAALAFAREAADALRSAARPTLIVDCNAIAPDTVQDIAGLVERAGGRFLDASIIGPPPRGNAKTNLYVSGPGAADLEALAGPQLTVHAMSERIGDASALKMCFGALNKGTQALWLEVLIAAQRLGVAPMLERQLQQSRAQLHDWALSQFPMMPPKAYRWVPEMLEISKTLAATGIGPKVFEGAADIYRFVADTTLGKETPENRDKARAGRDVVRALAEESMRSASSGSGKMRDLAPDITRQRLLIEGCYTASIDRETVQRYLLEVAAHLDLQSYGEPVIHAPSGVGKAENAGFDAFLPLIDSGISLYVWSARRFFAVVLFTCKRFDVQRALDFTRQFFSATQLEHAAF
jgi:3-hydroxyisobutyrate dehydrogenase-like beta-hydroxyacid dehydrogenase